MSASRGWSVALAALAVSLLATLFAYGSTVASFVRVWGHSDTFAYGFFVVPVSLYLVWRAREEVRPLTPRPALVALAALLPLGLLWYAGRAASTALVEQFALVAMIPVLTVAHLGPRVARRIAFPLAFLFFAVPFGDVFTPSLMNITAEFAAGALRWTGVAVAREGLYITTTTARWQVIESCSGLRFTVAGVVLATFFGYLTYRSLWKRALFVAAAVVVSILANGLRAYVLILLGHLSDLRQGRGLSHYAYGWIVFAGVMTTFFLIASRFRDRLSPNTDVSGPDTTAGSSTPAPITRERWASVAAVAIILTVVWPAFDRFRPHESAAGRVPDLSAPAPAGSWVLESEGPLLWRPSFDGAVTEINRLYDAPDGTVQCYIAYYANQSQGRELLRDGNDVAEPDDPASRLISMSTREVPSVAAGFRTRETVLGEPLGSRVVWHWYWIPDETTTNAMWAKWLQARSSLLGRPDHAAVVVLSTTTLDPREAEARLARFTKEMLPSIHRSLRQVHDGPIALDAAQR